MTFIGAHVGCYVEDLQWVDRMLSSYPNFNVDIAARVGDLGRQPRAAARLMRQHPDRVLLGTDAFPPRAEDYRLYFRFLATDDEYFAVLRRGPPGRRPLARLRARSPRRRAAARRRRQRTRPDPQTHDGSSTMPITGPPLHDVDGGAAAWPSSWSQRASGLAAAGCTGSDTGSNGGGRSQERERAGDDLVRHLGEATARQRCRRSPRSSTQENPEHHRRHPADAVGAVLDQAADVPQRRQRAPTCSG